MQSSTEIHHKCNRPADRDALQTVQQVHDLQCTSTLAEEATPCRTNTDLGST